MAARTMRVSLVMDNPSEFAPKLLYTSKLRIPCTYQSLTVEIEGVTTEASDPKAPYAVPTLTISTLYHSACAFLSYARYSTTGQTSFALGAAGSTGIASIGLWCILFASSSGRISRKTGADKRTSGFPFRNREADKKKAGKKSL